MGKFNKKPSAADSSLTNEETSIDWSQLITHFQNQSVDQAMENIMAKISTEENIEFDQICLVLKHYLLLADDKSYLNHFIKFNQSVYFNLLIERFNAANKSLNVSWMLSELIKLVTSVCDLEQANYMLNCEQFRTILCSTIFDKTLLVKLNKANSPANRISIIEAATLTNLFETISNLCDINNNVIQFVTQAHIEWMSEALVNIDCVANKDLIVSIARLFHLFTEISKNNQGSNTLGELLLDLFTNKTFIASAMNNFIFDTNNNMINNNLVSKLYLINTFVNVILTTNKSINKAELISQLLQEYGSIIDQSLNYQINSSNIQPKPNETSEESEEAEYKNMVKIIEASIECKLLSIDIIKIILNNFNKEEGTDEDLEEEEIIESDDEGNDMETEQVKMDNDSTPVDNSNSNLAINPIGLLNSLISTIINDDENFLQHTDKIEHIYNSINLIKFEASQTSLLIIQYAQNNGLENNISINYLLEILKYLIKKPIDETKNDVIGKIAELCFSLFYNINNKQTIEPSLKLEIINLIKDIFFKYKTDDCDLCIELSRILALISIKERNINVIEGQFIIDLSAKILIELIGASFELNDQNTIQSLKLNAELIDLLIDLFSEDNLQPLEVNLNFLERIKYFSDRFYSKYKLLASKKKLKKDDGLIVKTVRDNLKSFVDYKIQKSK